jgi:uncharacterized tellurite resistance protein B-like protein
LVDRAIDDSARLALTRNLEPDQRLAYSDLIQVIVYGENQCRSAFIMGPIRARPMEHRVAAERNNFYSFHHEVYRLQGTQTCDLIIVVKSEEQHTRICQQKIQDCINFRLKRTPITV